MAERKADAKVQQADECGTKSLLRWKPDYEGAASLYEKAATNYKNAKWWDMAQEAFARAADAQEKSDNLFNAARDYEGAAAMAKEQRKLIECSQLFEKAANLYRRDGKADRGADVLTKGAKMLEEVDVDKAIEMLNLALELFETEDKEHLSGPTFAATIQICLRNERHKEAVDAIIRQTLAYEKLKQPHNIWRAFLAAVVVHLSHDDYVSAERCYNEALQEEGFAPTIESQLAARLLDAYDQRDDDALKEIISDQIFTFLENGVGRISRNLKITGIGGGGGKKRAAEPSLSALSLNEKGPSVHDDATVSELGDIDEDSKVQRPIGAAPIASSSAHHEVADDDLL